MAIDPPNLPIIEVFTENFKIDAIKQITEQGHPVAQVNLGFLYKNGDGLPQNYLLAHMWYNIASKKEKRNEHWRDGIETFMTPAEISEAQRRARICMETNYKDCD